MAGFHTHKWISNEPDVTADIAEEDRTSEIDLKKRELPTTKNLGFLWAATENEGGVRGVRIPQNRTEIRINTAQNNIRNPQTALKLPENF